MAIADWGVYRVERIFEYVVCKRSVDQLKRVLVLLRWNIRVSDQDESQPGYCLEYRESEGGGLHVLDPALVHEVDVALLVDRLCLIRDYSGLQVVQGVKARGQSYEEIGGDYLVGLMVLAVVQETVLIGDDELKVGGLLGLHS